jgi:glutaredoxin
MKHAVESKRPRAKEQTMAKEVVFYDGGCANCQQAAAFFSRHGVDYVRKNVKAHPEFQQELASKGAQALPSFIVDGKLIAGWDEASLKRAIGI